MDILLKSHEQHNRANNKKILLLWASAYALVFTLLWGGTLFKIHLDRANLVRSASIEVAARAKSYAEQVLQTITPYDTDDAKQLLGKQTELLAALETTNTMLVSENSKLRVHLSFMPIRYRQEIETMQRTDNQLYREQRKTPKNISSRLG